jgi:RNA polymerase sigma-70 factor (ECF subfamily)
MDRLYQSVLVLRCQTGDQAAFEELVSWYQPRLRSFLQKMIRDRDCVDDVLQEIWFDVFRGLSRLADPGAFPAWLYQVARHRMFHELQKRRLVACALEGIDLPAPDAGENGIEAEAQERVHAALNRINPEHRKVLLLRFMDGMSYQEIAHVIGCQLGTVRSRLHYAKEAFRHAIEVMQPA